MINQNEQTRKYVEQTTPMIEIDEDERGTFAIVPGEHNNSYRVDIYEDKKSPVAPKAINCNCASRQYRPHTVCKHMQVVNIMYQRIASHHQKPATQTPPSIPMNELKQRMEAAPLGGSKPFSLMR